MPFPLAVLPYLLIIEVDLLSRLSHTTSDLLVNCLVIYMLELQHYIIKIYYELSINSIKGALNAAIYYPINKCLT